MKKSVNSASGRNRNIRLGPRSGEEDRQQKPQSIETPRPARSRSAPPGVGRLPPVAARGSAGFTKIGGFSPAAGATVGGRKKSLLQKHAICPRSCQKLRRVASPRGESWRPASAGSLRSPRLSRISGLRRRTRLRRRIAPQGMGEHRRDHPGRRHLGFHLPPHELQQDANPLPRRQIAGDQRTQPGKRPLGHNDLLARLRVGRHGDRRVVAGAAPDSPSAAFSSARTLARNCSISTAGTA